MVDLEIFQNMVDIILVLEQEVNRYKWHLGKATEQRNRLDQEVRRLKGELELHRRLGHQV